MIKSNSRIEDNMFRMLCLKICNHNWDHMLFRKKKLMDFVEFRLSSISCFDLDKQETDIPVGLEQEQGLPR
ncbi:hypothetical protein L1987_81020 [Smallanthus sonchifolius]|uniref:Uncharacterized protein n=1 Tax=Smallanthus sonchifolius TaxID=185202 RepID=A0ACB8YTJ3_9ASTR|nr:hypothetical protein L1987_81020 [Smallanthus sonchifolius]